VSVLAKYFLIFAYFGKFWLAQKVTPKYNIVLMGTGDLPNGVSLYELFPGMEPFL
jgi:hypothetical protein